MGCLQLLVHQGHGGSLGEESCLFLLAASAWGTGSEAAQALQKDVMNLVNLVFEVWVLITGS